MKMMTFTVGEPYPVLCQADEGMGVMLDKESLLFLITLDGISADEEKFLRKGELLYGCCVDRGVPHIVAKFVGAAEFVCHVNILKASRDTRDTFLDGNPANMVVFHVVDTRTNILRGLRGIVLDSEFLKTVRTACTEQPIIHATPNQVDQAANEFQGANSLKDMIAMLRESGKLYRIPSKLD